MFNSGLFSVLTRKLLRQNKLKEKSEHFVRLKRKHPAEGLYQYGTLFKKKEKKKPKKDIALQIIKVF